MLGLEMSSTAMLVRFLSPPLTPRRMLSPRVVEYKKCCHGGCGTATVTGAWTQRTDSGVGSLGQAHGHYDSLNGLSLVLLGGLGGQAEIGRYPEGFTNCQVGKKGIVLTSSQICRPQLPVKLPNSSCDVGSIRTWREYAV